MSKEKSYLGTNWIWQQPFIEGLFYGLERIPSTLKQRVLKNDVSEASTTDLNEKHVSRVLRLACTLIGEISIPLFYSTRALLRSIHIVESVAPDSDVSFSLPHFPHSIFLSIPPSDNSDAVPRLAESIIHEVMHLQLSLVERIYPLTLHNADLEHAYSPWLNIRRPIDGIIHGLFVFRALEDFWSQVCVAKRNGVLEFAENRVEDINNQCSVIKPKKYESLTRFGQDLFLRLAKPRKIALS